MVIKEKAGKPTFADKFPSLKFNFLANDILFVRQLRCRKSESFLAACQKFFAFSSPRQVSPLFNFAEIHVWGGAGLLASGSQRFWPPLRVAKFLVSVLCHGFGIVTGFAESLPVVPSPEQFLISPMGNDMIHNRRLHITSFGKAPHTKWMGLQVGSPCFLPAAPVSFLTGRLPVMLVKSFVFFTVHGAVGNQPATARMLTRSIRSTWHGPHVLSGSVPLHGQCHELHRPHHQLWSVPWSCGTAA